MKQVQFLKNVNRLVVNLVEPNAILSGDSEYLGLNFFDLVNF